MHQWLHTWGKIYGKKILAYINDLANITVCIIYVLHYKQLTLILTLPLSLTLYSVDVDINGYASAGL